MSYTDTVLPIMRELRGILMPKWGNAGDVRTKSDLGKTPVTDVDIAVERHTAEALRTYFSDIPFVGEENGGDRSAARFWLMDPIDGSGTFARGQEGCTSMLALIDNGKVVFSVIYDFVHDAMYWAERGKGAFRDKERLAVSAKNTIEGAKIYWEGRDQAIIDKIGAGAEMTRSHLAGWGFVQVATGVYDARIALDPYGYDFDFAPGSLLVQEAGGTMINPGSSEYDYTKPEHIAANPVLCRLLDEKVTELRS